LRLNDPAQLSFIVALLKDGGIDAIIFDQHTSVLEGSASAIPRRLMVLNEDEAAARRILIEAGELDA